MKDGVIKRDTMKLKPLNELVTPIQKPVEEYVNSREENIAKMEEKRWWRESI